MGSTRRLAALALLLAACGENEYLAAAPPVGPDPVDVSAAELYGLQVGARWTYLRSGDVLRWKEITGCEEVLVLDVDTGEPRTVRAYVRENRGPFGTTSVHYLVADAAGVHRIRRDDVDEGELVVITTYDPASPRLLNGPYHPGDQWFFEQRTAEFDAVSRSSRGQSDTSAVDEVLGFENITAVAGTFRVLTVARQWDALNPHRVRSDFAAGVGEVREETVWPDVPLPRTQIEELVEHSPGYASCDGPALPIAAECPATREICPDAWGTGVSGCTDVRVDAFNCGACGATCEEGVCAGGTCQTPGCDVICEGTSLCCPSAWGRLEPGCTNPSRDRWNCGRCGNVCAAGLICDRGECVCGPGTADCDGTGRCRGVLEDPRSCGACGRICDGDTPICDKGVCVESCLSVDLTTCGSECVDLAWDSNHCGACGKRCGAGTGTLACQDGTCVTCAAAGLADCNGTCVDLQWSDKSCGSCGNACAAGEVCVFGGCVGGDGTCASPCTKNDDICCNGGCINPRTSDHHCGGCSVAQCLGGCTEACRDGTCTPVDCGGGDD